MNLRQTNCWTRRDFFRASALPATGVCWVATAGGSQTESNSVKAAPDALRSPLYTIGLSQYSLHRTIESGQLDLLDYPQFARDEFGIEQIDVFGGSMPPVKERLPFLEKIRARSEQAGSKIFLMQEEPIRLVSDDASDRSAEINRFAEFVDQTSLLGADFLRVFLDAGTGPLDVQTWRAVDGLKRLADYAATKQITVVIEPGIGASRNGLWLAGVLKQVGNPNCGSMPDFGKFGKHDKYNGTSALMASARVISARSHQFSENGLELRSDYPRLFQMIVDAGFRGIVAIDYEGHTSEVEGIQATQKLLQRLQETLLTA